MAVGFIASEIDDWISSRAAQRTCGKAYERQAEAANAPKKPVPNGPRESRKGSESRSAVASWK